MSSHVSTQIKRMFRSDAFHNDQTEIATRLETIRVRTCQAQRKHQQVSEYTQMIKQSLNNPGGFAAIATASVE